MARNKRNRFVYLNVAALIGELLETGHEVLVEQLRMGQASFRDAERALGRYPKFVPHRHVSGDGDV